MVLGMVVIDPRLSKLFHYTKNFRGPYTQSYMGTGINFLPAPTFRTGVIHFCHPRPFWNCILPFSYTSPFLELDYYTYHSILLYNCFPANTFRNVLLQFFLPLYPGQFHRIVLLHFCTAPTFVKCNRTFH
jgi:hypothetical protein